MTSAPWSGQPLPNATAIRPQGQSTTGNGPMAGGSAPGFSAPVPLRPMAAVIPAGQDRATLSGLKQRDVLALVLAAGLGKRMLSRTSKLAHHLAGRPMVRHVVEAARSAGALRTVVVIGNQADEVRQAVGNHDKTIAYAYQKDQHGTGHAVLAAERQMHGHQGIVLILNGDLPALRPETIRAFTDFHRQSGAPLSLLTSVVDDPTGYGRIIRNYAGDVARIVEEADATAEERATQEINCGIYCAEMQEMFRPLRRATRDNAQGEIYLTDLVEILKKDGRKVAAYRHPDPTEVLGVNNRRELAMAARSLYRRKADALLAAGVSMIDPDATYVDADVHVGRDSVIEPGVMLLGSTEIGEGVHIGAGSRIADTRVGAGTMILAYSVISGSQIGRACRIGPFAHLRPESTLDEHARVGNFVETKKARLGRGAKANHLAYLGDAEIGRDANIGAGTITCNYDGVAKHRTIVEDEVFIGSDSQIVAPVRIRRGAYVGAGSTITRDVPAYALAISRGRQEVKEDWAKRFSPRARQHKRKPHRSK